MTESAEQTRRQDILLITLLGVAHGLSHFFHLVIPSLFAWIMPEFETSFAQMGSVMTVFFVTSSLGQAASGVLVDRFGARICLYAGVALLAAAGFLLAVSFAAKLEAASCAAASICSNWRCDSAV